MHFYVIYPTKPFNGMATCTHGDGEFHCAFCVVYMTNRNKDDEWIAAAVLGQFPLLRRRISLEEATSMVAQSRAIVAEDEQRQYEASKSLRRVGRLRCEARVDRARLIINEDLQVLAEPRVQGLLLEMMKTSLLGHAPLHSALFLFYPEPSTYYAPGRGAIVDEELVHLEERLMGCFGINESRIADRVHKFIAWLKSQHQLERMDLFTAQERVNAARARVPRANFSEEAFTALYFPNERVKTVVRWLLDTTG